MPFPFGDTIAFRLSRFDHELWKGALGDQPLFDLHIVLWDEPECTDEITLQHLARDFAEVVKAVVSDTEGLPPIIAEIALQLSGLEPTFMPATIAKIKLLETHTPGQLEWVRHG